ncbi:MAG: alanine--tRNA ligase, partial [Candidatus Thermoplasmatota archaeon]|nr:alanine--tRNA ligase [Candidatus Thermoplasmatota archaeon]
NDLEDVGRDTYHHTFFEMLGNWSFGDYYKAEAIEWAWELMTKRLGISKDRLWATVFLDDDEAASLWAKVTDIDEARVLRFDEKENFWAMGPTGPCGPCSEIHVDLGIDACTMKEYPSHSCIPNAQCGRYVELWNLVFIQFNRGEDGKMRELPSKHVDTGMGFERLVAVLQGKLSNYDTDLFTPIIGALSDLSSKSYADDEVAFRVIADHLRALTFAIADGIMPSNEGRGYVLRMILRRAYRFGCRLGLGEPFLYKLVPTVARIMAAPYPELEEAREHVSKVVLNEEERFQATLATGLEILEGVISSLNERGEKRIPGDDAFKLYDTYGFPVDLIREIAHESGMDIDEEGFTRLMGEQREKARASWKGRAKEAVVDVYRKIKRDVGETVSKAYDSKGVSTKVAAILVKGEVLSEASEGEEIEVILEETPFYAEAGGQIGDRGKISAEGLRVDVEDTVAPVEGLIVHRGKVLNGTICRGQEVEASIDQVRRAEIARNHTATHLLQAALRQVLGGHIKQSGSLVDADRLRFDFTHYQAVGERELERIEEIVNENIMRDLEVRTWIATFREIKGTGVIA